MLSFQPTDVSYTALLYIACLNSHCLYFLSDKIKSFKTPNTNYQIQITD